MTRRGRIPRLHHMAPVSIAAEKGGLTTLGAFSRPHPPAQSIAAFVLDFDGTLTKEDTISKITSTRRKLLPTNNDCLEYDDNLKTVIKEYLRDREAISKASYSSIETLLEACAEAEFRSLERVERYGLLGGLSRDDLRFTGSTSVKLQEGVEDFLVKTSQRGIPIHICSANWSKDLIIGALQHLTDGKAVKLANVASSDLEFDERGSMLSTGKIRRNIVVPPDFTTRNY
eukprot:jgi/Bigna1/125645/aug1.1_g353